MPAPEQSAQQSAEDAHMCIAFMIAHARTRDIAEAKDAADRTLYHLSQLAKVIPRTSPLSEKVVRVRAHVNSVRQNLTRQYIPDGIEEILSLARAILNELKNI